MLIVVYRIRTTFVGSLIMLVGRIRLNCFFFFKQKTAYEMRISDWSSDVCSSDLAEEEFLDPEVAFVMSAATQTPDTLDVHFKIAPKYYMYRERFELDRKSVV